MKYRLLAAIVCTAFSFIAIGLSLVIGLSWFPLFPLFPLFIAAWIAYLLILFFWVRHNCAPKALLIVGTLLGFVSLLCSYFMGLMFAFPAIVLMLHVIWCSFRTKTPDIAARQSVNSMKFIKDYPEDW